MEEDQKVKAKVIIEILGAPESHVKETIGKIVDKVKENKDYGVTKEEIFDPKQQENKKLWSTFCELELEVKELQLLINFCFDFMPSSVEVLSPEKFQLTSDPINDMLNDLIGRLHQYDMLLKNLHAQNIMLKKQVEEANPKKKETK